MFDNIEILLTRKVVQFYIKQKQHKKSMSNKNLISSVLDISKNDNYTVKMKDSQKINKDEKNHNKYL